MKRVFVHLSLGVALGAFGAIALRHATAPDAPANSPAPAAEAARPAPSAAPWTPPLVLDAAAAAGRLDAWLAGDPADRASLRLLLPVLPANEFPRLAEALLARPGGEARACFQEVFDAWVERDAAGSARWAAALPEAGSLNGRARRLLREQAGLAWARADLDAALVWAHALPDAAGEWSAAAMIYGQLAGRDPQRALALVRARADDAFFQKACRRIYDGWATRDPAAALQNLGDTLLGGGVNLLNLSDDIGRWITRNPDAALRWVMARAQDSSPGSYVPSLFGALSENTDPALLVPALLRATREAPPTDLFRSPLQAWVEADARAATAWLDGLDDPALRTTLLLRASGSYTVGRPWESLGLALLLPASAQRDEILVSRVTEWVDLDPDAALAWLKEHDEPAAATAVQAKLIGRLATTDRPAALARLAQLPPGREKRTATRAIAAAWARSSPPEAAAWLASATSSASEVYNHQDWGVVIGPWFKQDPATVRDWINTRQDAALREEAGTAWMIGVLNSPFSHAERAELVLGVADEADRHQAMLNVAAHWFKTDAAGARAWIEASPLPQAIKDSVIQAYDRRASAASH